MAWRGVARHKQANMPVLARYAKEGYAIVSAIPSCTLMFKQELPLMFPACADTQAVKAAMFDPFEYFVARHKDGLLKTDFKTALGRVSYHIPCHGRVQKIGKKTEEMFNLVGSKVQVTLNTVERCSGHAGAYSVRTATDPVAMKIGKPVFKAVARDEPYVISSEPAHARGLRHDSQEQQARRHRPPLTAQLGARTCTSASVSASWRG